MKKKQYIWYHIKKRFWISTSNFYNKNYILFSFRKCKECHRKGPSGDCGKESPTGKTEAQDFGQFWPGPSSKSGTYDVKEERICKYFFTLLKHI